MEYLYFLVVNSFLGAIALIIKSKVLADYWPQNRGYADYDDEEIINRKERTKKIVLNISLGSITIWEALFCLLVYKLHPNPTGR